MNKIAIFVLGLLSGGILVYFLIQYRFNQQITVNEGGITQPSQSVTVSASPEPTSMAQDPIDTGEIKLGSLEPHEVITSPLAIEGQAPGPWFFEATFPVVVVNWDGLIIGEGYAAAQGEWMTEAMVPFRAEINFEEPEYGETGALIFQKANPSGLPENDQAVEIPIRFE